MENFDARLNQQKKILIGGLCLALLCITSIVTITQIQVTALKSIAFFANGFSLGVFFLYYLLQHEVAQRQLSNSAKHLTSIEHQTEPICQFLPDGTLTFFNDACCNYFGKFPKQLIGNKYMIAVISKTMASQYAPFPLLGVSDGNHSADFQADCFFNLSSDLLVISNFAGYFTYINPAWSRIIGYTAQELTAQPFLEFVHPEDQETTLVEMARLIAGMPVIQFDNRYRCKDGSYKWLSWTAQPLVAEKLIYGVVRDLNKYEHCLPKPVKSVLQQQRQHLLKEILKQIRQSVDFNEILATTVREVPQDLKEVIEFDYLTHQGARYYQVRIMPELTSDGTVDSILAIGYDITECQQAETALRERERQLTAIAANIPGTVYRCLLPTAGGMSLLYVSEGIKELVGIESQEAITDSERLLELIHH